MRLQLITLVPLRVYSYRGFVFHPPERPTINCDILHYTVYYDVHYGTYTLENNLT